MQIACVVPLYPPHSRVGAWLSTHECLKGLARQGHEVTVVAFMAGRETYELDDVRVIGGEGHVADAVHNADVVVTHAGDNGVAHNLAWDADIATVLMVHGEIKPAAEERYLRRPPRLTVANAYATAETVMWPGRIEVIYPPVWPGDHATTPGNSITLVNLSEAKGGKLFWQLAQKLPQEKFLGVYGGHGQQVHGWWFNTTTSNSVLDMRTVWQRTKVLLMPSEKETWGRVGIEAMCSGIPVIAHPTDGLQESLGEAGIFVDRKDFDGWVRAIAALRDPEQWQRASVKSLHRAYSFTPEKDVARFVSYVEAIKC